MHWDPEQWVRIYMMEINRFTFFCLAQSYRAEGGKHIVVYNLVARKVLRIIKADRGAIVSADADRIEIERRLKFEKLVIVSLSQIVPNCA